MAERESELTTRSRDTHYVREQSQERPKPEPTHRPDEHEPHDQAHAIRQDIDQTRQRLDRTIDTLQLRLSPRYMAQQTMDKIKHQSSRAGHGFTHTIRENPLPAIVSGIGIAWLLGASMRRGQEYEAHEYYRRPVGPEDTELRARQSLYEAGMESQGSAYPPPSSYQSYGEAGGKGKAQAYGEQMRGKAQEYGEQMRGKAQEYGEQMRGKAQDYGRQARETAEEYRHRAAETASHLRDRASEMGHHMREQASHTGERLRSGTQHAQENARDLFNDHPLSVGLGVMAAGMALGLLAPATRKESELLGEQRDKLMHQAQAYGSDLAERGKAVAERAGEAASEAAQEEASEQGLAGGSQSQEGGGGGGEDESGESASQQPS